MYYLLVTLYEIFLLNKIFIFGQESRFLQSCKSKWKRKQRLKNIEQIQGIPFSDHSIAKKKKKNCKRNIKATLVVSGLNVERQWNSAKFLRRLPRVQILLVRRRGGLHCTVVLSGVVCYIGVKNEAWQSIFRSRRSETSTAGWVA